MASRQLQFRHRIGLLVSLAAIALVTVTAVTLVLGRHSQQQLTGIETQYVPLLELDRDLKTAFAQLSKALEDAAAAAEDSRLRDADTRADDFVRRLTIGRQAITDNAGDPRALESEFRVYFASARAVSAAIVAGTPAAQLGAQIEDLHRARQAFTSHLDTATSPDRRRLTAAFATARASQAASLWIDIAVATTALALMALLSWRIIRRTVQSLRAVAMGVERLARGELGHEIEVASDDEFGDLAREANRTAVRLREYREQREREDWIKTGLGELAIQIAGDLDPVALAGKVMTYLASYFGAEVAVAYSRDDTGEFRALASYGVAATSAPPPSFRLGETVRGEVARDNEVRVLVNVPVDHLTMHSTSGARTPRHVVIVPLTHEGRALGVLELGLLEPPSKRALELMSRVRRSVGIAFRVAESRERVHALLAETQRQAVELRAAKDAAEMASREFEAFSYSVAHDLRAPLRGIDGFSLALLEDYGDKLDDEGRGYLGRVRHSAQSMAQLIDALLMLARVSRTDVRREPVDLSELARGIVRELHTEQPDRRVDLQIAAGLACEGDSRLLRAALVNLLGNAWKFTSKQPDARIEFARVTDDDAHAFFIRDNGAGFDMAFADKLFGVFQRLHAGSEFEGTGIGLATVQRIIRRHGGRVWAEGAVGRGATFYFTVDERSRSE